VVAPEQRDSRTLLPRRKNKGLPDKFEQGGGKFEESKGKKGDEEDASSTDSLFSAEEIAGEELAPDNDDELDDDDDAEQQSASKKTVWPLFQVPMAAPYALYLRDSACHLGCKVKAADCHPPCCKEWNCADTVTRILQDVLFESTADGVFPPVPMHAPMVGENGLKKDPLLTALTKKEVKDFFTLKQGTRPLNGLLQVDEYCTHTRLDVKPRDLFWQHAYLIERHAGQCYWLQSDIQRFSVSSFLSNEPLYPGKRRYKERNALKRLMGYMPTTEEGNSAGFFGKGVPSRPAGLPCRALFDKYVRSYPEITAIEAFQRHCLEYYQWKTLRDLEKTGANFTVSESPPSIPQFRTWDEKAFLACNDESPVMRAWSDKLEKYVEVSTGGFLPGLHLNSALVKPAFIAGRPRKKSLSGRRRHCVAIASVPVPK